MFSAKDSNSVKYDTLISTRSEIRGDITVTGAIHVDGTIIGNIQADTGSKATVRISEKGKVQGQISAPNVIVNGQVDGDITSYEYVEMAKKARVNGDVYYKAIEMVLGAQINGKLIYTSESKSAPISISERKPAAVAAAE